MPPRTVKDKGQELGVTIYLAALSLGFSLLLLVACSAPSSLHDFVNGLWLEEKDPHLASSIKKLGWTLDGIDSAESSVIQSLLYLAVKSRLVASSVVSLDWVQDGIDDGEADLIEDFSQIAVNSRRVASSVVSLGWVQDGIDDGEADLIEDFSQIALDSRLVASSVISLGWVQDGIDGGEADLIEDFRQITAQAPEAALRIVDMPFLKTIEPPDISAMTSLRELAAFNPETFDRVMSHAALRNGIPNAMAPVVAMLRSAAKHKPALIDVLLDPAKVFLERRTITLPLSGEVVLAIVRTGPGAARSMELLEHSVRSAEEYIGVPLPTNYFGLFYENAVIGSSAGTNSGTHITVLPKYDVDDGSHEAEHSGSIIAHEVAHYYWRSNADWVDEGAADIMASIIEGARTGRSVGVTNFPCAYADSIADLEGLGTTIGSIRFDCNYSLGERLFVDLYRTLGNERFHQGFRDLYLASEVEDDVDNYKGTAMGIEHVSEAFRSDDSAASTIIARWYDGTEPYNLSHLDTDPVDASLPGINGRIDKGYITRSVDGPAVSSFSARYVTDWVYLALEYSYNVSGGPHEVPMEVLEYYEDGFVFERKSSKLTVEDQYIGITQWIAVGAPPSEQWAPGRYGVQVYAGGRKVAEVEYEVSP